MNKDYNYLDHRNKEFDEDYEKFNANVEELKSGISSVIEQNYDTVWESPQAIKFLVKFEKVRTFKYRGLIFPPIYVFLSNDQFRHK